MNNKTKIDRIHELLPKFFGSRTNVNWSGLIEAIGQEDEQLAQLIAEVRKQFFIKTSSRPYIDTLAANNNIVRPRLVGMSDASFRNYIPVLSYQPKQVKLIIDLLLDIFFFKESTTAFLMSSMAQPFALQNAWDLQLKVDGVYTESIVFNSTDFTNIAQATADEIVAAYNRQSKYSYATNFYDSITKHSYIRIFTNTVGSKGSLEILGGLSNIALRLNGFLTTAGNGTNTQWTVTKVGDTTTYAYTGGVYPGINQLQVNDILISNLPGNVGSFPITDVDVANSKITFTNLFSTVGVFTQTSANDTKFIRPDKYVVYKVARRAATWETTSGEVTVEMPTTPPVVQRSLKGSWHLNGVFSLMSSRNSDTSLTVSNAAGFPRSGSFVIEPVNAITSHIITPDIDEVITNNFNGRLISNLQRYTYSSRIVLSTPGSVAANSNQITVGSTVGLSNGMTIFMNGLREDAVITNIVGSVVTSSVAAQQDLSGIVEFGDNTLVGISPNLPTLGNLVEYNLTQVARTAGVVTCDLATPHGYTVGQSVILRDCSGINVSTIIGDSHTTDIIDGIASTVGIVPGQVIMGPGVPTGTYVSQILSLSSIKLTQATTTSATGASFAINENVNGSHIIMSTPSLTQFTFIMLGTDGVAVTPGIVAVETIGLSSSGSKILITNAQSSDNTRIKGSYVWDLAAPFVLSSLTAQIQDAIIAGQIVRLLPISGNEIPNESGYIIFDYGKNTQEGPVRYLYKPADQVLALDPSYIFTKDHALGSSIVVISHRGPHAMDGLASEYGPYITDPSEARVILEALIKSVTSAGIFVNFLIRYPTQLFGCLDVYNQNGNGIGAPL